jgi:hypothetical protein
MSDDEKWKRIGEGDPACPPGMAYYGDESTWTFGDDDDDDDLPLIPLTSEETSKALASMYAEPTFDAALDKSFNDAMAQVTTSGPVGWLEAWMPTNDTSGKFFGVDRTPSHVFLREYPGTWKLTIRERIRGAWRGMVNGWREG